MKLKGTPIPGFKLDKHGNIARDAKRLDVSARIRQRGSKRVRVVPPRPTSPAFETAPQACGRARAKLHT
jgi:hypothetical protein